MIARRWCALAVAVVVAAPLAPARSQDDATDADPDLASAIDGRVLVPRDAVWQVASATAPALTVALGPAALGVLDATRGGPPAPSVFGEPPPGAPPPGWPFAVAGTSTPLATAIPAPSPDVRVAAMWAATDVVLDPAEPAIATARVLELRLRYRDGVVVWWNGIVVARREVPTGHPLAIATRPRGPEWERLYVPVVPGLLRAGRNTVAVEVRPAAITAAPSLELEIAARPGGRVVRGPMVQRVGADRATIVVETDLPTAASLAWGPGLDRSGVSDRPRRRHEFELRDLPTDATVRYQLTIDGVVAAAASFATAPAPGAVVELGIYGDVRGGHRVHGQLVERLLAEAPDAVLVSGDLVLRGSDDGDWQRFFAVTAPLVASIPYYPAVGNHDLGRAGELARRITDVFALPPGPPDRPPGAGWYGFSIGDVHVVMLDSNAYDNPLQRAWLEAELTAAASARAVIAVVHDGPYARGLHGGNQQAVRDYVPILVRHRVTLLVSGHDHLYQRGVADGLPYLVSGGGGAPLYRVRCGVPGRSRCARADGMVHVASEHHYVMVTIHRAHVELCPRRIDGSPLEPCWRLPLRPARSP